ncbi:flagellar biosynthesis regulatory protein FlaF [Tabrizicola piscis]|uniref:Flagellar biosynthesis regulatory protein FlaF n=1 Tax=Tabrizicola piscis TaxID=2494374 RepID=A0A3S8U7A6_9RHOB|nr:flagellar biosynthesis regulator FlaF [Tabrizicola piscis]AZL59463.1 flagellar biosynthesis regulatory protein FlaF [Tabrizicola piscis]
MTYQSPIAYATRGTPARSLRSVEYDLIAQVTQRLRSAWAKRTTDFPALAAALADNQQLWSTLALDVAQSDNGLPAALRAQLFYLYEFTAKHSRAVLDGSASAEVLTDINMAMLRGLRGDGGGR